MRGDASDQGPKGSTIKKTLSPGSATCGSWLTTKWTCALAKGSYRRYVYAKDLGGNAQVPVGSKSLTVKQAAGMTGRSVS